MQPVVNGLEQKWKNEIAFRYIDRELPENADIVAQYGIRAQPVYILLDGNGNEVKRWFGAVTAEAFEAEFNAILSK